MANARWRALARSKKRRRENKADRRDAHSVPVVPEDSDIMSVQETDDVVVLPPVQPAKQHPFAALDGLLQVEDEAAS